MPKAYQIALLPGDGIGPEVVLAARRVLDAISTRFGHTFDMREWPIGGAALRRGLGPLPDETRAAALAADAVLLGAVGDPAFDAEPRERKPETGILELRRAMGVYANLRPARLLPGLEGVSALTPLRATGVDLIVVRELTGGLYFGEPRGIDRARGEGVNTLRYSAGEIERIAVSAFDLARARRKHVTSVDKANVLETSQLWREVVSDVATRYPDVRLSHMYVDACALALALDPRRFDVIVTENLFGDILSDESGAIVGSLGLLPSASLGGGRGLFEPVHGTAPDLAGRDLANPIGAIGSAAMLLQFSFGLDEEARAIEHAIDRAIADGSRTVDIAAGQDPLSCSAMTDAILDRIPARTVRV